MVIKALKDKRVCTKASHMVKNLSGTWYQFVIRTGTKNESSYIWCLRRKPAILIYGIKDG